MLFFIFLFKTIISRTTKRSQTFYDGEEGHPSGILHLPMDTPFCPDTSTCLKECCETLNYAVHPTGQPWPLTSLCVLHGNTHTHQTHDGGCCRITLLNTQGFSMQSNALIFICSFVKFHGKYLKFCNTVLVVL